MIRIGQEIQCLPYAGFLATGTTFPAHMYRQRGQSDVPDIDEYIQQKLNNVQTRNVQDQIVLADDSALLEAGEKAFEDNFNNEDAEINEQEGI